MQMISRINLIPLLYVFTLTPQAFTTEFKYTCKNSAQFYKVTDKAFTTYLDKKKSIKESEVQALFVKSSVEAQQATLLGPGLFEGRLTASHLFTCWGYLRGSSSPESSLAEKQENLVSWERCVKELYGGELPSYGKYVKACLTEDHNRQTSLKKK